MKQCIRLKYKMQKRYLVMLVFKSGSFANALACIFLSAGGIRANTVTMTNAMACVPGTAGCASPPASTAVCSNPMVPQVESTSPLVFIKGGVEQRKPEAVQACIAAKAKENEERQAKIREYAQRMSTQNAEPKCVSHLDLEAYTCHAKAIVNDAINGIKWKLAVSDNIAMIYNHEGELITMYVLEPLTYQEKVMKKVCKTLFPRHNFRAEANGFGDLIKVEGTPTDVTPKKKLACSPCNYGVIRTNSVDGSAGQCSASCKSDPIITILTQRPATEVVPSAKHSKKHANKNNSANDEKNSQNKTQSSE